MIPLIDLTLTEIVEAEYPNRTYKITSDKQRISGYVDELEALKQAIYLILNTERYKFPIYSWDYGVELIDLFGKPIPYVKSEIKRRVGEALIQDNRVERCSDFEFQTLDKRKLHVTFTVHTIYGTLASDLEVTI